jgi:hypothetical protein
LPAPQEFALGWQLLNAVCLGHAHDALAYLLAVGPCIAWPAVSEPVAHEVIDAQRAIVLGVSQAQTVFQAVADEKSSIC